jgi:hypothetical protein
MPKITGLEHTLLLVAAAALGAMLLCKLAPGLLVAALVICVLIAVISFVIRKGWRPSL